MKFLIATEPDDIHAIVTKLALEEHEQDVRIFFTADQPTRQKNSVYLNAENYNWYSEDDYNFYPQSDYDVVWWRRPRKPFLPKTLTHPEDYQFVLKENYLFFESLINNISPQAWWINPLNSFAKANLKILQLRLAARCNLAIPITLCSNNPTDIRDFILQYQNKVIYKCFCSNFWFE